MLALQLHYALDIFYILDQEFQFKLRLTVPIVLSSDPVITKSSTIYIVLIFSKWFVAILLISDNEFRSNSSKYYLSEYSVARK